MGMFLPVQTVLTLSGFGADKRYANSKFAVTSSCSKVPSGLGGEQYRGGAEHRKGAKMAKKALLSLLHIPSHSPCCPSPMLTHHFPCYGSTPLLPPLLAYSPPLYTRRQLTWRGRKDKRDYFLLLRELNWFIAGPGEWQSLCRWEGPHMQQLGWRGICPFSAPISYSSGQPSHNTSPLNIQMCPVEEPVSPCRAQISVTKAGDIFVRLMPSCPGLSMDSVTSRRRRKGEAFCPPRKTSSTLITNTFAHRNTCLVPFLRSQSPFHYHFLDIFNMKC